MKRQKQVILRLNKLSCIGLLIFSNIAYSPIAIAHSFSNAKKTYVPATLIERRVDYDLLNEESAFLQKNKSISKATSKLYRGHINVQQVLPKAAPSIVGTKISAPVANLSDRVNQLLKEHNINGAEDLMAYASSWRDSLSPADKAMLQKFAQSSLARAKTYLNSQDPEAALKLARQAVSLDPNSKEAKDFVNNVLKKSGINPSSATERLKLAQDLANKGQMDDAKTEYLSVLQLHPKGDEAFQSRIGLGDLAQKAGSLSMAKSEYEKAIELKPNSALAYRQLGLLKYRQADLVGANSNLSKALMIDSHDEIASKNLIDLWQKQINRIPSANSHFGLARAYQLSGNLPSAQEEYRQVVRLDPNNPNLPAARRSFKYALAKHESEQYLTQSRTLASQGALQEAYEKAGQAAFVNPANVNTHLYQAELAQKLGLNNEAKTAYLNVLKQDPKNVLAANKIKELTVATAPIVSMPIVAAAQPATLASSDQFNINSGFLNMWKPQSVPQIGATVPSSDPLTNITNFTYSLRNHILGQKEQLAQAEDSAHSMLRKMFSTDPAAPLSSPIEQTLASATPETSKVESVLAKAKSALVNTGNKTQEIIPPIAPDPTPRLSNSAIPIPPVTAPAFAQQNMPQEDMTFLHGPIKGYSPTSNMPAYQSLIPDASSVNLELVSVIPRSSGIDLVVNLRNESSSELKLPEKMKAIIRGENMKTSSVKARFANSSVMPHNIAQGVITVPFNKVDPRADLSIPNLLPPGIATSRDVHLTTSISLK